MNIISTQLLEEYLQQVPANLQSAFDALQDAAMSTSIKLITPSSDVWAWSILN